MLGEHNKRLFLSLQKWRERERGCSLPRWKKNKIKIKLELSQTRHLKYLLMIYEEKSSKVYYVDPCSNFVVCKLNIVFVPIRKDFFVSSILPIRMDHLHMWDPSTYYYMGS